MWSKNKTWGSPPKNNNAKNLTPQVAQDKFSRKIVRQCNKLFRRSYRKHTHTYKCIQFITLQYGIIVATLLMDNKDPCSFLKYFLIQ